LHLHELHSLALVLTVVHCVHLEVLLADAKLLDNLEQFGLHKHLFFLDGVHNYFLVGPLIIILECFSSLGNELLLALSKLGLTVERADLEDFEELFKLDSAIFVKLEGT
jgi:hypothetical protein